MTEAANMAAARSHGELVDRLMARIGELEAKLYDKELSDANFTIPAIHGELPLSRCCHVEGPCVWHRHAYC
jgi:hypothetical protein